MPRIEMRLVGDRGETIDDLLPLSEAAQALGVVSNRVRQLVMTGVLRPHRINDRCYLLERRQVEAYAASYRKPGPKPAGF